MDNSQSNSVAVNLGPHPEKKHKLVVRLEGTLRGINADRGFGFIRPDNGDPDYWVQIAQMRNRKNWREGQRVRFVPGPSAKPGKAIPAFDVAAIQTDKRDGAEKDGLPSAADLDTVAEERRAAVATSFAPTNHRRGGRA